MEKKKVVVIGGDAAGMSSASQVKRLKPDWDVIVFEKSEYVSYAACGMPYFLEKLIPKFEDLIEITPEKFINERKIDLRLKSEVTNLNVREKYVVVNNNYKEKFDYLVIATGASPVKEGIEVDCYDRIFTLNNLIDAKKLSNFIENIKPQKVAIIGGGFIAIEMAEAFKEIGLETHLIHRRKTFSKMFEDEISEIIEKKFKEKGVILHMQTKIDKIVHNDKVKIFTDKGEILVDFVLLCIGVKPETEIFKKAGIKTGIKDGIIINEKCQTNFEYIYSAGDCALAKNIITGKYVFNPLALKANREGYVAGRNISGKNEVITGITQTSITKIFDTGISRTGLTYEQAKNEGFDAVKFDFISRTKARYYPGSKTIKVVGVCEKGSGKILGAQFAGPVESVKRIDVFATAIYNKMTLKDLFQLDLAYAPPFSPVWDPVLLFARLGQKYIYN